MFQNSWSIKLAQAPQYCTIANLPDPSFVYQGTSNNLSVYTNNQTHPLPIRKQVIALNTSQEDKVLLLTRYNLSCFDLLNNQERFNLQFQNAEKLYVFNQKIYVVCGTSLYCYNYNGEEEYVNHVSANIVVVAKVDGAIGDSDLIIATTDMIMFRYQKLNIIFDYGKIIGNATSLCWINKGIMVGTQQGPIAFYQSKKYKWKAKSIHPVFKILKFEQISKFNKNAQFQANKQQKTKVIVCRNDGNLQLRDWENGATLAKIKVGENIVDVFVADFRKEGINQIVCGLESGTIRALNLTDQKIDNKQSKVVTAEQVIQKGDQIQKLNKIKQQLLFNISQLKNALASAKNQQSQEPAQILNPNFKVILSLDYQQGLVLQINSTNCFISGLTFQQPLMPILVQKTQKLRYHFLDSSQSAGQIQCEIILHSSPTATKYQVIKRPFTLPKFWKWGLDPKIRKQISGKLKFKLIQRNSRFIFWIRQCFYINIADKQLEKLELLDEMKFRFYNWYENKQLEIVISQREGRVCINCDCLKTMGEIFQDLINYIGIKHLNSQLQFPEQKQKVKQLLETVQKLSQNKVSMSTDLADTINTIKFLLVKGESARQVSSMNTFRKTFGQIMQLNRNLVTEIDKKNINMKVLTQTLKNVNIFINQIANVRYGQPKNQVIAKCRQAIKTKKFPQIYSIMNKGFEIQ